MPSVSSASLLLSIATERLTIETERANVAERKCTHLASELRSSSGQIVSLQLQLDKTQKELGLYRIQLDLAQKEIQRAEEIVAQVDRARLRAEEQAARYRSKVRRLTERAAINDALQKGRESGFREGLERGKAMALSDLLARYNVFDNHESGRRSRPSSVSSAATSKRGTASLPRRVETPINVTPVRPPSAATQKSRNDSPTSDRPRPPSVKQPRPLYQIPPDGYIPTIEPGSAISLPPPHELSRPLLSANPPPAPEPVKTERARPRGARSSSIQPDNPPPPATLVEDNRRPNTMERSTSPASTKSRSTESRSTDISQYEFVRTPFTTQNAPQLLPEIPSSLLHIHKLPSPSNSPAIYRRPLRDELEDEEITHVDETSRHPPRASADRNAIGIDIESASDSTVETPNNIPEPGFLTPSQRPSVPLARGDTTVSQPTVLSANELPPGFVPTSPIQP